jgi:hypothetical protein
VGAVAKRDENGSVRRKRSQQIKAPYRTRRATDRVVDRATLAVMER